MSEPNGLLPDWTSDEKAAILARGKHEFTIPKLIEYVEDDDEKFPAAQVLAEIEAIDRESVVPRQEGPLMVWANDSPPRYTVELTGLARAQLRAAARYALYSCKVDTVVATARDILTRLPVAPDECGDTMHHLKARCTIRSAAVRPLYVEYAVHEQQPLVIVRHVASVDAPG